jgi:tripartite-type tricarboxylate transporter receptor subunit TctC
VIARMEQALQKVLAVPEVANAMARRGATVGFLDARAMGEFMAADAAKWKRVADFAKISLG